MNVLVLSVNAPTERAVVWHGPNRYLVKVKWFNDNVSLHNVVEIGPGCFEWAGGYRQIT